MSEANDNKRKLTRAEYVTRLHEAYHIAQQLLALPLDGMLEAISLAEATGPLLAPSLYLEKGAAMGRDRRVIEALVSAQGRLRQMEGRSG